MRVYLIRHAVTDQTGSILTGWTPGVHLNEAGHEQANSVARRLADVDFAAVITSPLERCRETAAPIARIHQIRPNHDKRLGELGYGSWTGRPVASLARTKLWTRVQYRPSLVTFPEGEPILAAQSRIVGLIERLRESHKPSANVACCSHADVIKLALAHYAGMHIDLYQRLVVATASVSVIRFDDFGVQIERLNDVGELAP